MSRTDRLVELLEARDLDSLLVTDLSNVRYLTGFTGTNGACVVTRDERLFFTDFRYVEQARAQVPEYERIEAGRDMLGDGPAAARTRRLRRRAISALRRTPSSPRRWRPAWSWCPPAGSWSSCGR